MYICVYKYVCRCVYKYICVCVCVNTYVLGVERLEWFFKVDFYVIRQVEVD